MLLFEIAVKYNFHIIYTILILIVCIQFIREQILKSDNKTPRNIFTLRKNPHLFTTYFLKLIKL